MTTVRVLVPGDEARLEAFLRAHPDTTMFLQGNLRQAGLVDRGQPYEGTYVGVFEGEGLVGALAHAWNGMFLLEAPVGLEAALHCALRASGRGVKGFSGELAQATRARELLGLQDAPANLDDGEVLYTLPLEELRVPAALGSGAVRARRAEAADLATMIPWAIAYHLEAVNASPGDELAEEVAETMRGAVKDRRWWVASCDGELVAQTRFNATTPDAVQVGGVYTPPEFRARGYAACAVAQSLLDMRAEGVSRSILFTAHDNTPARRCYEGLGYEAVGEYGLILLRDMHPVRAS